MTENYIQYASGYQKDNIDERDILKAISDIFEEQETKYQAKDSKEVEELYKLLLLEKFDEITSRIK